MAKYSIKKKKTNNIRILKRKSVQCTKRSEMKILTRPEIMYLGFT